MKFQQILLGASLALATVMADPYAYKNDEFQYNFNCLDDNKGVCQFYEKELFEAVESIAKIADIENPIKFEAFVDDLSKYRLDKTREDIAVVLDNEYTPLGTFVNIESPYPNSEAIAKKITKDGENDFIVVLNNFKSNEKYLDNLKEDVDSSILVAVFDEIKALNRVGYPYVMPKNTEYIQELEYSTYLPKREDLERIDKTAQANTNTCIDLINGELTHTVIHWEDTLISKGKTIGKTYGKKVNNRCRIVHKNKYRRVVAVPDIHGDYEHLISILRHAKIIDEENNWIATDTILIQTGDLLNRGNDTMKIYETVLDLREQAAKKGGIFYNLIGNHEIFEVRGNHYFTSSGDFDEFGGMLEHEEAFGPDGKYGQFIRNVMNTTMIIDDTLFTHAGIRPDYLGGGIEEINKYIRELLQSTPSPKELGRMYKNNEIHPVLVDRYFDDYGPFWLRDFAKNPESEICPQVEETLRRTNTKRMVIGHTPQSYGKITSRCSNKLIIIDIGVSRCIGGGYYGYLEILNDKQEVWARYFN
jgi:hypothetical protein